MNKNELIAWLQNIDGNPRILISADEEGNSFSELYEVGYETEDDDSELVLDYGGPVIVLWP
jgi:hypothetical protein